jgi:DNA-binding MarR family transcriptional regulator
MAEIRAPFTPERVAALNRWQHGAGPFTCANGRDENSLHRGVSHLQPICNELLLQNTWMGTPVLRLQAGLGARLHGGNVSSSRRPRSFTRVRSAFAAAATKIPSFHPYPTHGGAAMSEYQYYEFQAIDRPLDKKAMADLRKITSRAEITPTSLINEYHWGDFKGDPARLMEKYFDAFLYMANWGTRQLMLRLPAGRFQLTAAKPYLADNSFDAWATKTHVILNFHSEDEGDEDLMGAGGWLGSLIPLRGDLLAGDMRCLYLAWLAGTQYDVEKTKNGQPPPIPGGLGSLSASLKRFADFMRLEESELRAAAKKAIGPATPPHAAAFTHRQGQFLAFLYWYRKLHRHGPAETDFARYFRVSPPAVHSMIVKLSDLGLITGEPGTPRSLRLLIPEAQVPQLEETAGPPW